MRIAVGADHAGYELKQHLLARLRAAGHEAVDVGTHSSASCDYPEYAAAVARAVASGQCERGLLVCGTGIGMAIAANKLPGIRAAACQLERAAEMARRHNDANVLCLGARLTPVAEAERILEIWLATPFEGGRHQRRLEQIAALEACQPAG